MNKTIILVMLMLSLIVNVAKAYALNVEKFGPVLDGDQMEMSKQFINI